MPLSDDPRHIDALNTFLSQFFTAARLARMREVLAGRTRHVTVVLEDLYQTQNISAVLRTCDCFGVQDAYIIENKNPFIVHDDISMGAHKWLTLHRFPCGAGNVGRCVGELHDKGYFVLATLPGETHTTLYDLPAERKTAFMFGTELTGLSDEAVRHADGSVRIPMYGFTESFNISNSAAIILSEFTERMRRSAAGWRLGDMERKQLFCHWLLRQLRDPEGCLERFRRERGL